MTNHVVSVITLNSLPNEIILKIFSYVLLNDLLNIRYLNVVCKKWHELCYSCSLWKCIDLSYKKIDIKRFLNNALGFGLLANASELNLNGLISLKTEQMSVFLDNINKNQLKKLHLSRCTRLNSSIFVELANRAQFLELLDIQSMINEEVSWSTSN